MTKIYNEIVIDMNPESSTFEETLYEDSFEYNGDMALAQGDTITIKEGTKKEELWYGDNPITGVKELVTTEEYYKMGATARKNYVAEEKLTYPEYENVGGAWVATGNYSEEAPKYDTITDATASLTLGGSTDWGAPDITADMFIDEQGNPREVADIYADLDPILTGISGGDLVNYINDLLPKYQKVKQEERDFITERADISRTGAEDVYGLGMKAAGRDEAGYEEGYTLGVSGAERDLSTMLGGLQSQAHQFAPAVSTGVGMRSQIAGMGALKKGLETGYDVHGDEMTRLAGVRERGLGTVADERTRLGKQRSLGMRSTDLTQKESLYGLEDVSRSKYETSILSDIPIDYFADPGTDPVTDPNYFASHNMREGGRVPNKETFLDFLTQLPDAGGM